MILVLDHYDSFIFNIIDIVKSYGFDVHHAFYDQVTIKEIEALKPEKIILSPGPKHPDDAPQSQDIIRHFGEKDVPILGICLGHQLIGSVYGAKIENYPAHGVQDHILHDGHGLFQGLDMPFPAARYHSLSLSKECFSSDLIQIAYNKDNLIMAVQHKTYPIYGVQFHPESILTEGGKELILNFLNI